MSIAIIMLGLMRDLLMRFTAIAHLCNGCAGLA
jgi:hypothetical protein